MSLSIKDNAEVKMCLDKECFGNLELAVTMTMPMTWRTTELIGGCVGGGLLLILVSSLAAAAAACLHARKKRTALNEKSKASATVNTTQGKLVVQREAVWVTNVPGLSKPFY